MPKAYLSNLTQAQYELLSDMIPEAKPGGRPRCVEMWDVLNAIFYEKSGRCSMASIAK
jgi:transposase